MNVNNSLLELVNEGNIRHFNLALAKAIGLNEAILYYSLVYKHSYWSRFEDYTGEFFVTAEELEANTTLTKRQQSFAIDNLIKHNLISKVVKGAPPKRFFTVNQDLESLSQLLQNVTFKSDKMLLSKVTKCHFQKLQNVTRTNISNTNISNTNNNNVYEKVITHLNEVSGKHFRVTEAVKKLINGRLTDGFNENDFIKVVDNMGKQWKGTKWEQYLRPITLFAPTKFDSYLNWTERRSDGNSAEHTGEVKLNTNSV